MPFVMTKEYRENYYEKNKEKYMKRCICGVCGRELFRGNLRRHQKSHLCKSPNSVNKTLEIIPPLPQPHEEVLMPSPSAPQPSPDF